MLRSRDRCSRKNELKISSGKKLLFELHTVESFGCRLHAVRRLILRSLSLTPKNPSSVDSIHRLFAQCLVAISKNSYLD
jgi:hypothetical protein